ncbi:MAG TPA: shikimate kinase [Candidatus Limiplasma sp.]|nr:shikimate kinase [Candidatus Limiplasma sp.]HRX08254.1 shikimate kinase [Candidatus Limiplasma sp.]
MSVYGLLGETLRHSFSPQIHACLGAYEYRLFEIQPEDVRAFLEERAFDGMNVTIPYKKTVIPYCAELSDRARRIGSVNTIIKRDDGSLFGDNTDYFGFAALLDDTSFDPAGQKAVILGSGGSSATVRAVLEDRNSREIVVISRSGENNYQNLHLHRDAALIVNTTPVGMYPHTGVSPIVLDDFPACRAVIDIIYNPAKTRLLLDAEAKGIPCVNGLKMLTAQAKRAAELFTGKPIRDSLIGEITDGIMRQTMNVVLIGMPSCGKTTVGNALAQITSRELLDTDTLIERQSGRSIPEIIETDGVEAFRKLETATLAQVTNQSGKVIATGGGIVTVPENLPLIRQNSVCVFLHRDLQKLTDEGRPLSKQYGVETLYKQRLPLYREFAEFEIDSNASIGDVAQAIKEALQL